MNCCVRNVLLALFALVVTAGLAGCVPQASLTCTVKVSSTVKTQNAANPNSLGSQKVISVSGELVASDFAQSMAAIMSTSMPDAASFTMDTSGSTIIWPSSGTILLTVKKLSNDDVVASKSFGYTKLGSKLVFANPSQVNAWLESTGASPAADKLAYKINGFTVTALPGTNVASAKALADTTVMSSSSATFLGGPVCGPGHHTGICRN